MQHRPRHHEFVGRRPLGDFGPRQLCTGFPNVQRGRKPLTETLFPQTQVLGRKCHGGDREVVFLPSFRRP